MFQPLFFDYQRDFCKEKPIAMPIYEFVCRSLRPEINGLRNEWNAMFDKIPVASKADVRARFCSDDDCDHMSAAFEIFLFWFFDRLGYRPEMHTSPGSSKADLLINDPHDGEILVEALCLFCEDYDLEETSRKQILDALRTIKSKFFNVAVGITGASTGTPSINKVIKEVTEWLASLDYGELSKRYTIRVDSGQSLLRLSQPGLQITVNALPLDRPREQEETLHFVYSPNEMAVRSDIHERIRKAFHKKAQKRYGEQNYPVYLAANVFDFVFKANDAFNALLGDELIYFKRSGDATPTSGDLPPRNKNGFWRIADGKLLHSSINGCIFFDSLRVDNYRSVIPFLIYNPYIQQDLHFKQIHFLDQYYPDTDRGIYSHEPGQSIGGLFDSPGGRDICPGL